MGKGLLLGLIILLCLSIFSIADLGVQTLGPSGIYFNVASPLWDNNDYELSSSRLLIIFDTDNSTILNYTIIANGVDPSSINVVNPLSACTSLGNIITCNGDHNLFTLDIKRLEVLSDTNYNWEIIAYDSVSGKVEKNLTLQVLNDNITPTYTLNGLSNWSFFKPSNVTFGINYIENESGFSYSNVHYDWLSSVSISSNNENNSLTCNNNLCTTTIYTDDGTNNNYLGMYFEVVDNAGNKDYTNQNDATWYYFYVDKFNPIVSVNSPIDGFFTSANSYNFNYNLDDNSFVTLGNGGFNPNVKCDIYFSDGSGLSRGTQTYFSAINNSNLNVDLTVLSDGNYNWFLECVDSAGWKTQSINKTIIIDRNGPVINLTSNNNNDVLNNNSNLIFTITDSPSGVASVWSNVGPLMINGNNYSLSTALLSSGENNFTIYANDTLGNLNSKIFTINIDDVAPVITSTSPLNNTYVNDTTVWFIANDNYASNNYCSMYLITSWGTIMNKYHIGYKTNNLPIGYTFYLSENRWGWIAECTDEVGNSANSTMWEFIHDKTAPQITDLAYSSLVGSLNTNGIANFTYNINDTDMNGQTGIIDSCNLYINNTFMGSNSGLNFTNVDFTSLGQNNSPYTWEIKCNDSAGNINSDSSLVYYDYLVPIISGLNDVVTSSSVTLSWSVNENSMNSVFYGLSENNTSLWTNLSGNSFTLTPSFLISALSSSTTYFYQVQSCDQFNNCVNTTTNNFTTATTPVSSGGGGGGSTTIRCKVGEEKVGKKCIPIVEASGTCTESWNCREWSSCDDGTQTRTCLDWNVCGTEQLKPSEQRDCEMPSSIPVVEKVVSEPVSTSKPEKKNSFVSMVTGAATGLANGVKGNLGALAMVSGIAGLAGLAAWKKDDLFSVASKVKNHKFNKQKREEEEIRRQLKEKGLI